MSFDQTKLIRGFIEAPFLQPPPIIEPVYREREGSQSEEIHLPAFEDNSQAAYLDSKKVVSLPRSILDFVNDRQIALFLLDIFGITSKFCALGGADSAKAVPYLSLLAAPVYLYHATKQAYQRLKMMCVAFKAQQYADSFFFATRAVDSMGTAIGVSSNSLFGGIQIGGAHEHPVVGLIFATVIPIVMVVTGAVGALSEGWALWKNAKILKQFNEKAELDGSLDTLVEALEFLQGPNEPQLEDKDADAVAKKEFGRLHAKYEVEKELRKMALYTNDDRQAETNENIESLLKGHDLHLVQSLKEQLSEREVKEAVEGFLIQSIDKLSKKKHGKKDPAVKEVLDLANNVQELYEHLLLSANEENPRAFASLIEEEISLYEKIDQLFQEPKIRSLWKEDLVLSDLSNTFEENINSLKELKDSLLNEGESLLAISRSEIHRNLLYNALSILLSLLFLVAGVLMIVAPHHHLIATILSVSASVTGIAKIIFDKKVDREQFHKIETMLTSLFERNAQNA